MQNIIFDYVRQRLVDIKPRDVVHYATWSGKAHDKFGGPKMADPNLEMMIIAQSLYNAGKAVLVQRANGEPNKRSFDYLAIGITGDTRMRLDKISGLTPSPLKKQKLPKREELPKDEQDHPLIVLEDPAPLELESTGAPPQEGA